MIYFTYPIFCSDVDFYLGYKQTTKSYCKMFTYVDFLLTWFYCKSDSIDTMLLYHYIDSLYYLFNDKHFYNNTHDKT